MLRIYLAVNYYHPIKISFNLKSKVSLAIITYHQRGLRLGNNFKGY